MEDRSDESLLPITLNRKLEFSDYSIGLARTF